MEFLNFYFETNEILENFYKKININITNFEFKKNKLNYIEKTFFNCGSNLFIIDVLGDNFDKYYAYLNKHRLSKQEKIKKIIFIKQLKINNFNHKYSEYFDKYFYNEFLSVNNGIILKEYLKKIGFYADSIYKRVKYILTTETPIIKGSIENFHPNYYFIPPFDQNINFNVVLSNIFLKLLGGLNIELLNQEMIIKLLQSWFRFYIIKIFLLSKIPEIKFVNAEDYYKKYLNKSLINSRLKKAINRDNKIIKYKYKKIQDIQNDLKQLFIEEESIINNDLSELIKEFYILSNFLLTPIPI